VKIALFTPWPPELSGIADYSYRLALGFLEKNVALEIHTSAASPTPLGDVVIHRYHANDHGRIDAAALPLFQLGNNVLFHAFQPAALARLGGVVQLHDPVLHHLHVDRTLAAGEGGYWEDLEFWYGAAVARACRRLVALAAPPWSNVAATAIPFFEPYLQFADAVVVHSQSALRTIEMRMPGLAAFHLPQSYPLEPQPARGSRPNGPLRLGVFGWVEPHKRVDQILLAIAELRRRGIDIRLDICGQAGAMTSALADQIETLGLAAEVQLRGHLEHERFISEIAKVDVCVNLRDPSMGETSAIVTQALQLGTPVIVTDTGWYAELPDCVLKVPPGPDAVAALVSQLIRLDADRKLLASLAEATRRYASTELDFPSVVGRYIAMLGALAEERAQRRLLEDGLYRNAATSLAELDLNRSDQEELLSRGIINRLSACY
jgi:glycosyltransferase involved in cell wall biosynthesis